MGVFNSCGRNNIKYSFYLFCPYPIFRMNFWKFLMEWTVLTIWMCVRCFVMLSNRTWMIDWEWYGNIWITYLFIIPNLKICICLQVIARRVELDGKAKVLLRWFPAEMWVIRCLTCLLVLATDLKYINLSIEKQHLGAITRWTILNELQFNTLLWYFLQCVCIEYLVYFFQVPVCYSHWKSHYPCICCHNEAIVISSIKPNV